MAEASVRMSGIVLASLMFQHVNSDSDTEGLILGETRVEEQVTISDSQADHVHIEETYRVQKHVTCQRLSSFYGGAGDVSLDALQKVLADNEQSSVIGWYRQRRNSEQQMSFREKLVHEQLQQLLSNPQLVFLLLTPTQPPPPGSTHRTEYAAFAPRGRRFANIPVQVTNLGPLEQPSYWKASAPAPAAGYSVAMEKHSSAFFCSDGVLRDVSAINRMNESLQAELQNTCSRVEQSERRVEALQVEVEALRRRLTEEKKKKKRRRRSGDEAADGPEPSDDHDDRRLHDDHRLHDVLSALFVSCPLLHSRTLTLEAFPVPCCRCGVSTATADSQDSASVATADDQDAVAALLPAGTNCRKRLRDEQPATARKRRKSSS